MSNFEDLDNVAEIKITALTSKCAAKIDAKGGNPVSQDGGLKRIDPTPPGEYLIAWHEKHVSHVWPNSMIAWDTPTRLIGDPSNPEIEVYIEKKWVNIGKISKDLTPQNVLDSYNEFLSNMNPPQPNWSYADLPKTWRLNDFGPKAVLLYQDKNHDGKFQKNKDAIRQEMFHTTPQNHLEKEYPDVTPELRYSHGCIHILPDDMIYMSNAGYFAKNTTVIVHPYSEKHPEVLSQDNVKPPYTLHFYPGSSMILVYGN